MLRTDRIAHKKAGDLQGGRGEKSPRRPTAAPSVPRRGGSSFPLPQIWLLRLENVGFPPQKMPPKGPSGSWVWGEARQGDRKQCGGHQNVTSAPPRLQTGNFYPKRPPLDAPSGENGANLRDLGSAGQRDTVRLSVRGVCVSDVGTGLRVLRLTPPPQLHQRYKNPLSPHKMGQKNGYGGKMAPPRANRQQQSPATAVRGFRPEKSSNPPQPSLFFISF